MTDQLEPQTTEEEIPQDLQDAFEQVASTEAPEPPEETPSEDSPPSETPSTPQEPSGVTNAAYERLQRLLERDPSLADHIGAWERGEAVLVPRQYVEQQPQPVQAQPQEPEPGFYDDPEGYVRRLEETVTNLQQNWTNQQQAQMQAELQRNQTLYETFTSDFRSKHPELDEGRWDELVNEVTLSGRVLRGVQSHGDRAKALREAFEREYRALYPAPSQEDQLRSQRQKRRAGAAASSPRPAQRSAPPEAPKTKQDAIKAAADYLRESQEANA